jgi:hypothetical protein
MIRDNKKIYVVKYSRREGSARELIITVKARSGNRNRGSGRWGISST